MTLYHRKYNKLSDKLLQGTVLFDMKKQLKKSLEYVLYNGIATTTMSTLSGGSIMVAYALLLGANSVDIGLIGNMGYISVFSHIFSAYLINRGFSVKGISILFSFISRFFYLIMAILAFFDNSRYIVIIFLFCMLLNNLVGGVSGGAFYPWMKSLIPRKILGTFFAKRYRFMMLASMICYILSAGMIFVFEKYIPDHIVYAYTILLLLAFFAGIYSVYTLKIVKNVTIKCSNTCSFLKKSINLLKDKFFMFLSIFIGMFCFTRSFVLPFFVVFLLKKMEINMSLIIVFTIISNLSYVISTKYFTQYIKNNSSGNILRLGAKFFIITNLILIISMYLNQTLAISLIILANITLGISQFTTELGVNNMPLLNVPSEDSSLYLSVISVVKSVSSTISGILGGWYLTQLEIFNINNTNIWLVFFGTSTIIFILTIIFSKIIERKIYA